jgi:streptogramin lyase
MVVLSESSYEAVESLITPTYLLSRVNRSRSVITAIIIVLLVSLLNVPWTTSFMANSTQSQVTITEWTVPTPASGPLALSLDQSGNCCWFLEYYGGKLGHLDVNTNTFEEWPIPSSSVQYPSNPFDLAFTSNGGSPSLWGTEYGSNKVFAFSTTSNVFREYSLPSSNTGVGYISIEPSVAQLRVWFTETIRNANGELIYDPTSGNATLYEDSFPSAAGGGAYGVFAESNSVWFAGFSALIRWDRASQQYTMWSLPVHGSATGRFITVDSYGQPWYTQGSTNATSDDNFVGVLRGDNVLQEWRLPTLGADPRKLTINPLSEQPWIAERSLGTNDSALAVLSNSSEGTLVTATPTTAQSGGTPVTLAPTSTKVIASVHTALPAVKQIGGLSDNKFTEYSIGPGSPQDVVTDSQGNIWISEPATNKIARLSGFSPDFALSASPQFTSLLKGSSEALSIVGISTSGYKGNPTVSPINLPSGVTFSPEQSQLNIQSGKNASAQVMLDVSPNATAGLKLVTFGANDGTIAHATSVVLMVSNSTSGLPGKSQCLIATATYGSELSPEVELLRDFRNNILMSQTGASFLTVFNSWYYSFSPYLANVARDDLYARDLMKGVVYPLIGSLALSSAVYLVLSASPECATLISGLVVSCMIGAFYVGLPLSVIKRRFRFNLRLSIQLCTALLLCGLGGILVSLNFGSPTLLMIASSLTVLSATWGSATLTAEAISRLTKDSKIT